MVLNQEIVLSGQGLFRFSDQLQLLLDEIPVIHDLSAFGADEMMVMAPVVFSLERVATLAVARRDLMNETQSMQQFQGPVDRCQADSGIDRIQRPINVFSRQVFSSAAQKSQDHFAGHRPAADILPKTVLPLVSSRQFFTSYR